MTDGSPVSLLMEWQEYYHLRPFGFTRDAILAANICLTIAGAMGLKKAGGGQFKLADFMPHFGGPPKAETFNPEAALAILKKRYGNNRKPRSKPDGPNR